MVDAVTSPIENCPVCGGLGFFTYDVPITDTRFGRSFPCACISNKQRRIKLLVGFSGLEEAGLLDKNFARFQVHDGNRRAFQAASAFVQEPQGWLMFSGGVGRGKTHLLAAIGNDLLGVGKSVVYANAPRMLGRLKATFNERNGMSFEDRFTGLKEVDVLLLDDLGTEYSTEWAQTTFFELLDHRYSNKRATVIASNLKRGSFRGRLGSRLKEALYVELSGADYRVILGQQQFDGFEKKETEEHKCNEPR